MDRTAGYLAGQTEILAKSHFAVFVSMCEPILCPEGPLLSEKTITVKEASPMFFQQMGVMGVLWDLDVLFWPLGFCLCKAHVSERSGPEAFAGNKWGVSSSGLTGSGNGSLQANALCERSRTTSHEFWHAATVLDVLLGVLSA